MISFGFSSTVCSFEEQQIYGDLHKNTMQGIPQFDSPYVQVQVTANFHTKLKTKCML